MPAEPTATLAEYRAEVAKAFGSLRTFPTHDRSCETCGQTFAARGRGRYCSRACQVRAYRKRKKERSNP